MTLKQFIARHREDIDSHIHNSVPGLKLDNEEREAWISNDETLYDWARSEGVRI